MENRQGQQCGREPAVTGRKWGADEIDNVMTFLSYVVERGWIYHYLLAHTYIYKVMKLLCPEAQVSSTQQYCSSSAIAAHPLPPALVQRHGDECSVSCVGPVTSSPRCDFLLRPESPQRPRLSSIHTRMGAMQLQLLRLITIPRVFPKLQACETAIVIIIKTLRTAVDGAERYRQMASTICRR